MATDGAQRHSNYMNAVTFFGLMTVTSMLVSYALKPGRSWFFIGFAVSWALGSAWRARRLREDVQSDAPCAAHGSLPALRIKSRLSRAIPAELGVLPVRSAAKLPCPTTTATRSTNPNCRVLPQVDFMSITINDSAVNKLLFSAAKL
jgi:hypothetical protein